MFVSSKLGMRTVSAVFAAVFSAFIAVVFLFSHDGGKNDLDREAVSLAGNMAVSLRGIMLSGNPSVALEWIKGIKMVGKGGVAEVLRKDGVEAFSDNTTIDAVNRLMDAEVFARHSEGELSPGDRFEGFDLRKTDRAKLDEAAAKEGPLLYDENIGGATFRTAMVAVRSAEECKACHGYDSSPIRGYVKVSVPAASSSGSPGVGAILAGIAVMIGVSLLAARFVIRPMETVAASVRSLADGEPVPLTMTGNSADLGETSVYLAKLSRTISSLTAELSESRKKVAELRGARNENVSTVSAALSQHEKAISSAVGNLCILIENASSVLKRRTATGGADNERNGGVDLSELLIRAGELLLGQDDLSRKGTDALRVADDLGIAALNARIEAAGGGDPAKFARSVEEIMKLAGNASALLKGVGSSLSRLSGLSREQTASLEMFSASNGRRSAANEEALKENEALIENAIAELAKAGSAAKELASMVESLSAEDR